MAKKTTSKAAAKKAAKSKPKAVTKAQAKPKSKPASAPKAAAATKRQSWFDAKTHAPLIDKYARQLDTFMQTMADGVVDDSELKAQEGRLVDRMRQVEPLLNDAAHGKVTQLLCELTSYDIMRLLHEMQSARPVSEFRG